MKHDNSCRKLEFVETIPAQTDSVWDSWTTNKGIQAWLVEKTDIELSVGGKFEIYFGPDMPDGEKGSELCTILSYAPKKMLSFTWNAPPTIPTLRAIGPCTWVVLQFEPIDDDNTKLTLTHYGIKSGSDNWDAYLAYFESAWGHVIGALKKHFE